MKFQSMTGAATVRNHLHVRQICMRALVGGRPVPSAGLSRQIYRCGWRLPISCKSISDCLRTLFAKLRLAFLSCERPQSGHHSELKRLLEKAIEKTHGSLALGLLRQLGHTSALAETRI